MYALRDRAKAHEDKFAYDQAFHFRAESRRNKLMGLWAASLLGVDDASAYAQGVVSAALEGSAPRDIASKLRHDFDMAGIAVSDDELQTRMHDLLLDVVREMERG